MLCEDHEASRAAFEEGAAELTWTKGDLHRPTVWHVWACFVFEPRGLEPKRRLLNTLASMQSLH